MTIPDEEDQFYHDLDEKKSHKSCCTCQTMIIALLIILIIVSGVVTYLYWGINQGKIFQKNNTRVTTKDVENKFQNIKPDSSGEFEIILSAAELTALTSGGLSTEKLLLKDTQVMIDSQNILIYGSLVKPISSQIVITAKPVVENGRVKLVVESVTAGKINLPAVLTRSSEDSITNLLNNNLEEFYRDYEVKSIILKDGQMVIMGKGK